MQRPLGNDTHPHRQQHRARERIPNEVSTGAPLAPRLRPGGQLLEVFLEYPLQSHELLYAEDLPGAADLPIYLAVRQYARRGAVAAEMPAPHRLAHVDYEAAPNMARNALLNLFQHRALARHELLGWLVGPRLDLGEQIFHRPTLLLAEAADDLAGPLRSALVAVAAKGPHPAPVAPVRQQIGHGVQEAVVERVIELLESLRHVEDNGLSPLVAHHQPLDVLQNDDGWPLRIYVVDDPLESDPRETRRIADTILGFAAPLVLHGNGLADKPRYENIHPGDSAELPADLVHGGVRAQVPGAMIAQGRTYKT